MAEVIEEFNSEQKMEALKMEIIRNFDELFAFLSEHRDSLLTRLAKVKEGYEKNLNLDEAIKELKFTKENAQKTMKSNLLDPMRKLFDDQLVGLENSKVAVDNLEMVEFRCYPQKIRSAVKEIDLFEVSPEYVKRENPIKKVCKRGRGSGELSNPTGIAVDRAMNVLYICDIGNRRIQVLNAEGKYLRSFGTDDLKEPHYICLSQEEVFVTDRAKESIVKFSLAGQFLKETGSRGTTEGRFTGIAGLCHEAGLIYVCDGSMQRIQIFDSNFKFIKQFGNGELNYPIDITVISDRIYILSLDHNSIHCYNRGCILQNIIQLTGQDQPMIEAFFFTIDKKGNFLITDNSADEIRIFSPQGVMKHILGRGHLYFLCGIVLDKSDNIICVNHGIEGKGCLQRY
ncbi:Peptidylamidoglycolate lyase [Oopsacas minuta]|uniref:Peptidylamidoglycolate lyase n=1 Tax=Oopsacas minuta TaxID=111878 RepID=A0AAV7K3G4_9METZ|nr:Peptidylamidoglycolate lyase [Oopsacas minuta]